MHIPFIDAEVAAFEARERRELEEQQESDPEGYEEIKAEKADLRWACRRDWPEKNEVARFLLTRTKSLGKHDFASRVSMYRHEECKAIFDAFKGSNYAKTAAAVRKAGHQLTQGPQGIGMNFNIEVMRCCSCCSSNLSHIHC